MNDFVVTPPFFRITLFVAMETMNLHIAGISFFLRLNFIFAFSGAQRINWHQLKLSWGARLVKSDAGL